MVQKVQEQDEATTSWKEFPILVIKGFLMGSADVIPGVSGGTMALIVGIYSRLIHAIKSFDLTFFKNLFTFRIRDALSSANWKFMVMLLSGIFAAILFFTKVVPLQVYMFTDPEIIFGLFFGLILGSIFILAKELESFTPAHAAFVVLGTLIGYWVVTLVPTNTPESSLFVFFSGSIAICAMILPGISGSYILLILQKYDYILSQVGKIGTDETLDGLIVLIPFAVGAVVGLGLFSRLLSWLLDNYYKPTLAVLIGFLIGSLYVIWPYQDRTYTELVTETQVIEYNSPTAVRLRDNPMDENKPEFERLGKVINPGTAADEQKKIELLTVKKKLINSDPYIPYLTAEGAGTPHFWSGLAGMFAGLILVVGLDYLREIK